MAARKGRSGPDTAVSIPHTSPLCPQRLLLCFSACFLLVVSAAEYAGALGAPLLQGQVEFYHLIFKAPCVSHG